MSPRKHGFTKENAHEMTAKGVKAYQDFRNNPELVAAAQEKNRITRKMNKELSAYREKMEARVAKLDKFYERLEKELTMIPVGEMTAAQMDILLRYSRQLHEGILGKPKQQTEVKSDHPITLVIQEIDAPIEVEFKETTNHPIALIEEPKED